MAESDQFQQILDQLEPLRDELRAAIRTAVSGLTEGHDDIVGVAVFTDIDASTLVPSAETGSHLRHNRALDASLTEFYPWCPDEWGVQAGEDGTTPLDAVAGKINHIGQSIPDGDDWSVYTDSVFAWVVDVMSSLVDDGWFAEHYPDANVVFYVTDADIPAETVIEELEELNPAARVAPYAAWLRANE